MEHFGRIVADELPGRTPEIGGEAINSLRFTLDRTLARYTTHDVSCILLTLFSEDS